MYSEPNSKYCYSIAGAKKATKPGSLSHSDNWWSQTGSNRRPLQCHYSFDFNGLRPFSQWEFVSAVPVSVWVLYLFCHSQWSQVQLIAASGFLRLRLEAAKLKRFSGLSFDYFTAFLLQRFYASLRWPSGASHRDANVSLDMPRISAYRGI